MSASKQHSMYENEHAEFLFAKVLAPHVSRLPVEQDRLDACHHLARLVEQLEALGRVREAASALLQSADDQTHPDDGFPLNEWVELVEAVHASTPATDPSGYIELDDHHMCPHGVHKGLGCAVCDPANRLAPGYGVQSVLDEINSYAASRPPDA